MKDRIHEIFPMSMADMVDEIKKAKAAQIGEVRTWSGVKMQKTAQGWVPVKEGGSQPKADEQQKESSGQPQDLGEHAKSASEAALQNAVKNSSDPEVRAAAHRELERRNKEEKAEMFDRPNKDEGASGKDTQMAPENTEKNPNDNHETKEQAAARTQKELDKLDKEEEPVKKEEPKEVDEMMASEGKDEGEKLYSKEDPLKADSVIKLPKRGGGYKEATVRHIEPEAGLIFVTDKESWSNGRMVDMETGKNVSPEKRDERRKEAIIKYAGGKRLSDIDEETKNKLAELGASQYDMKNEGSIIGMDPNGNYTVYGAKGSFSGFPKESYGKLKEMFPDMKKSEGTLEEYDPGKDNKSEIRKSILTQSLLKDSGWIVKSHINEFTNNPELDVKVSGAELKVKFSEQLKYEAEEIRDYSIQIAELINEIGEMPQKEAKDCIGWKLDGWEDKIGFIPKMYDSGELRDSNEKSINQITEKMYKHDSAVRNLVDCMIEVVMLNTLINTIKDNKQYSLKVSQAAMLGF